MVAKRFCAAYNAHSPPKPVDMILSELLEFPERDCDGGQTQTLFACEKYIPGEYVKYNSNASYVRGLDVFAGLDGGEEIGLRMTPQAFSAFTFAHANYELIIVDIQGDCPTDTLTDTLTLTD